MFSPPRVPDVTLRNGVKMPILGLGTTHSGGYVHETMVHAVKECGYRLIDTARRYGTEQYIPHAIREANVDREDMFLATKLWPTDYGLSASRMAARASMNRLGTDHLDLYLMHWPGVVGSADRSEVLRSTWRGMELLLESGECRAVGVSNFRERDLDEIMEEASVVPHVNQCEFHPCQNPAMLRVFCEENGVQFQGHCPLAKGRLLGHPRVVEVANRSQKTPAQVLIQWSVQNGVVTIPKSTKASRVAENMASIRFRLSLSDMEILNSMHSDMRAVDLRRLQDSARSNNPDGYKLLLHHSSLPSINVVEQC